MTKEQERRIEYRKKTNSELRKIITNGRRALRIGITGIKASDAVSDNMATAYEILEERNN